MAEEIVALLPASMRSIRDPDATRLATLLELQSVPFAMGIEGGIVTGKAYVRDVASLTSLMSARRDKLIEIRVPGSREAVGHGH
jgi:hypothetical protein